MSEPPDLRVARPGGQPEGSRPPGEDDDFEDKDFVGKWIMPYVEDQALWPILLVIMFHVVAFITPVLVFAFRDRGLVPGFAVLWFVFLSVQFVRYEARQGRRYGALTWVLLTTWGLSAVAAGVTAQRGLF